MPTGPSNCPSCVPKVPHMPSHTPSLVNFCTLALLTSTTYTLPVLSTATARGSWNCPGPDPGVPHLATNVMPWATCAGAVNSMQANTADRINMRHAPFCLLQDHDRLP